MKIINLIDSIVTAFSPKKGLQREFYRNRLGNTKSRSAQYAAAKDSRLGGSWSAIDSNVNAIIGISAPKVRSRVRQLVRDFPYFTRAVNILTDYTVGQGIIFQSRIRRPDETLDKNLIQKTEDAFNFWADECDVAGKLHYYEMMQLAKRQDSECGEFIIVKTKHRERNKYLPFALQIYESDWLTSKNDSYPAARHSDIEIMQGVEYSKTTGVVSHYHFADPYGWGESFGGVKVHSKGHTVRIPAKNVIHGFKLLRPGQLRGISPFTSAVIVADDLDTYMGSEIDAAKMASKYLSFVKTPDPAGRQAGRVDTDSSTGNKIEEMENAIIEYLAPGEEIEIVSNPRPGSNFSPFVKLILQMISITVGAPYELLSGDYSGMNYSTGRTKRNDFSQELRPIAARHIRHFGMATFKPFMESAVMHGKLPFPQYFTNPIPYLRSEWQPPGMESVDPLRETKARVDEVKAGLRSPMEIVRSRGRELEEVYKEIKIGKDMAKDHDLDFSEVNTNLANNPAAVSDQDSARAELIDISDRMLEKLDG